MTNEPSELDLLMEQQERQLLEARMLPNTGPLTPEQREEVRVALVDYIQRYKLDQKEVARQVAGVGVSNLNAILNKKYDHGPLDDHLRSLNNWMEVDARRQQSRPQRQFVETGVARRIMGAARLASKHPMMVVIHGPCGIGKTMTAHAIVESFPGAIYIRISEDTSSRTRVRAAIADHLGFNRARKRKASPSRSVAERIFDTLRGSHRMIVIDEAHKLSDSALEFLRDVYDECGVPIVMLCTKDLLDRIRADADTDHGQLLRRIRAHELTRNFGKQPGDGKQLFTVTEIRTLYESQLVKLHPDAQAYLLDVANWLGRGSLGTTDDLMVRAVEAERAFRKVGPEGKVLIRAALLRKLEDESRDDTCLQDDVRNRRATASA